MKIETATPEDFKNFIKNTAQMKNKIQLSNGSILVINTYKMYADICASDSFKMDSSFGCSKVRPIDKDNASHVKHLMIESVSNNTQDFIRAYGKEPIGFVIQVQYKDFLTECFIYGCSVKSHLDKWDRMKGLKVAYADLMKNFAKYSIVLSKDERRKIAKIVGLN